LQTDTTASTSTQVSMLLGAMTGRWAPRNTLLRRNTVSIMKGFVR